MKVRKYYKYVMPIWVFLYLTLAFPGNALGYTIASRIAGSDRYRTSVEISKAGWVSSENVVLATGEDFPDAISAVPLAKLLNAPILLTEKDALNEYVEKEILRLNPSRVFIIGGKGAVSLDAENRLNEMNIPITRIYGRDRYETSLEIAKYMAANFSLGGEAVIVSGGDFADAVSVSSPAANKSMPILTAAKDYIPESIKDFLKDNEIEKVYVIGDNTVISDDALEGISGTERIAGEDKYQRNTIVLSKFEDVLDYDSVYFATGENFPDALACSALAAKNSSPVVLVKGMLSDSSRSFLKLKLSLIKSSVAVGGSAAVSDGLLEELVRDSIDNSGGYSLKPYDEFANYLMDSISTVYFSEQAVLSIDNISVSQDMASDGINIYLDVKGENRDKLMNYINQGGSAKANVELWVKTIGSIASRQYKGKAVKGSLWYVNSFDIRPQAYSTEDLNYNPATGKWDVMEGILDFSQDGEGRFVVNWK